MMRSTINDNNDDVSIKIGKISSYKLHDLNYVIHDWPL